MPVGGVNHPIFLTSSNSLASSTTSILLFISFIVGVGNTSEKPSVTQVQSPKKSVDYHSSPPWLELKMIENTLITFAFFGAAWFVRNRLDDINGRENYAVLDVRPAMYNRYVEILPDGKWRRHVFKYKYWR
ncbi:hypothetical protein Rin_00014620 [Candidatus Regiella insecticola 5.15]|uniref:Uncharacterized protein n=1 Tax=Candidatus Regiella insecticola 5.15 TaxID=1005043 RepID=G2H082_9ENTR|nr:hypothetical protein [Candidatus Regiella insecticola]EGY28609.1 hypothetical protein Rin_00014620 [Candidatus Regiella insecticola 5.15]